MRRTRALDARLAALSAALLFSTGGAAIKTAAFTASQVSCARSAIAAAALLIWLRGRVEWSVRALGIGVLYGSVLTLFVIATKLTTSANAIFLQSTAPLYILLFGPILIGERFRGRDLPYLIAVGSGLVCCVVGRSEATATAPNPTLGNLAGLAAGMAWGGTLMALRRVGRREVHPAMGQPDGIPSGASVQPGGNSGIGVSAVVAGNLMASIAALPFAWPFPVASAEAWSTLVYLGVFQIGVAYICLVRAVRDLGALELSLLLLLEPVLNPVWTWLIRGEHPGGWVVAGGGLIVAATAIKSAYEARAEAAALGEVRSG